MTEHRRRLETRKGQFDDTRVPGGGAPWLVVIALGVLAFLGILRLMGLF